MPRTFRCSFCGRNFNNTSGLMHIRNDGTIVYLCSRRCRVRLLHFKSDPRKLKWTEYYGKREKGR